MSSAQVAESIVETLCRDAQGDLAVSDASGKVVSALLAKSRSTYQRKSALQEIVNFAQYLHAAGEETAAQDLIGLIRY